MSASINSPYLGVPPPRNVSQPPDGSNNTYLAIPRPGGGGGGQVPRSPSITGDLRPPVSPGMQPGISPRPPPPMMPLNSAPNNASFGGGGMGYGGVSGGLGLGASYSVGAATPTTGAALPTVFAPLSVPLPPPGPPAGAFIPPGQGNQTSTGGGGGAAVAAPFSNEGGGTDASGNPGGAVQAPAETGYYVDDSYRLWLAHAPQLYAFCCTHVLERPSHTISWLADSRRSVPLRDYSVGQVVTSTNSPSTNYIQIYTCYYQCELDETELIDEADLDEFGDLPATFDEVAPILDRHCRVVHDGPVSFIASMPQRSSVVAVRGRNKTVAIYDLGKRRSEPDDDTPRPDLLIRGHKSGGFGIAWSPTVEGRIATGGNDGAIMMYDLEHVVEFFGTTGGGQAANPSLEFHGHTDTVEAVTFHCLHKSLLASGSSDHTMRLWDIRSGKCEAVEEVHTEPVLACQFHPAADFLVATTSADKSVRVWDIRKMVEPVAQLVGHVDAVTGVKWAPFNDTVLLSYGCDATVIIWDLARSQNCEEEDSAAPELVFRHNGHLSRVREADWAPFDEAEFVVASVDDNNLMQLWGPHADIINDDQDAENYNTDVI